MTRFWKPGVLSALTMSWLVTALVALALPAGANDRDDLHRRIDPKLVQCDHCHTTDSWKLDIQGLKDKPFDHGWTGFPLRGRHAQTACMGCHTKVTAQTRVNLKADKTVVHCENCGRILYAVEI